MLDQLMGTQRDGVPSKAVKFSDPEVCKTFLLGCCPHETLTGTRADLGTCKKLHDLALKADYEMAQKKKDYFYDFDACKHLQSFVEDTDRRIEVAKQRLAEQQAEVSADVQGKANAVHDLNEKIGKLVVQSEQLGTEGKVDEAKAVLDEIEQLKEEKRKAEEAYRNSMPASTYQQQKLRVCEICSAYLGLHDNDCRLADHFGGKLHLGFMSLREECTRLENLTASRRQAYNDAMRAGRTDMFRRIAADESNPLQRTYRRSRSRERPSRRSRSRDRSYRSRRSRLDRKSVV